MPTRAPKATSNRSKLSILRAQNLEKLPWLVHGFSTRTGGFSRAYAKGDLNLGFTKDDAKATVDRNRAAFLSGLQATSARHTKRNDKDSNKSGHWKLVTLRQVHSDIIHHVDAKQPVSDPDAPLTGDGLVTATAGLLLAIQTADCLPIILVDSKRRVVGVFHAGWRGTVKRIVEKGVGEMQRWFGTRPEDIKAAIGPGIGGCCYEVGEEVRTKFESQFSYAASCSAKSKIPIPSAKSIRSCF